MPIVLNLEKRIVHKKRAEKLARTFEVRDAREKQFLMVDYLMVDEYARILGPATVCVYIALCRHVGKDQTCWPSISLICEEMGMGVNTILRSLKKLEMHSIVHVDRRHKQANIYTMLNKRKWRKTLAAKKKYTRVEKGDPLMKGIDAYFAINVAGEVLED